MEAPKVPTGEIETDSVSSRKLATVVAFPIADEKASLTQDLASVHAEIEVELTELERRGISNPSRRA